MAPNIIDDLVNSIQKTWGDFGFDITPLNLTLTFLALLLPFLSAYILALSQQEVPLAAPAGCRKIGLRGRTNLHDQFSHKYTSNGGTSTTKPWTVKALFIYPIKSCGPVELEKTDIVTTGLRYDRQFTLAQYSTSLPTLQGKVTSEWKFITQRSFPRLAKVETEIWVPDPSLPDYDKDGEWVKSQGCVVVRFPFTPDTDFSVQGLKNIGKILAAKLEWKSEPMVEFRLPFNPDQERIKNKQYIKENMKIWKDSPIALNMGCEIPDEIMAQLKYTLGVTNPLTLFRIDEEMYREVYKCAPKKKDVGFQPTIGMSDSYPIHIMNLASVHDVSSRLPANSSVSRLSALRFRPNVLITGPPAFDEDDWKEARIGKSLLYISCRTTRCKLPNVDPETGTADRNEPGTTLLKYRVIDGGSKSACLGMQVTPIGEGEIQVGDTVKVQERGEHFFLSQ
ncbi:MOSC-domain-containing protein [Periconia macrospinosa]|uniref:MOSC-domain-containing protein n=1 Tax=Periconia macrospinosa TaxID=97972 RepID=A0A2V1E5E9_9PLEO|nr:MOSC-domain-containing protein [Periconia macrospinosa]